MYEKVYVAVYLKVSAEGKSVPVAVVWSDGTIYKIDKVLDKITSPPIHTGGTLTDKYRVVIDGREKIIYSEIRTNRWFVEVRR